MKMRLRLLRLWCRRLGWCRQRKRYEDGGGSEILRSCCFNCSAGDWRVPDDSGGGEACREGVPNSSNGLIPLINGAGCVCMLGDMADALLAMGDGGEKLTSAAW